MNMFDRLSRALILYYEYLNKSYFLELNEEIVVNLI